MVLVRACERALAVQNDLEVHYVLIRPFQGDLGTFFMCHFSPLPSPVFL